MRRLCLIVLCTALLAGCVLHPAAAPSVEAVCEARFEQLDHRLAAAGLHDAGAYRLPDFPYLRVTRFWASFADELMTPAQRAAWVGGLRAVDQQARRIELQKLGADTDVEAVLEDCGDRLVRQLLHDEAAFNRLVMQAPVPDDYSLMARGFGLYPLAVPFLRLGVQGYQREVLEDYATPLSDTGNVQTWLPPRWSEVAEGAVFRRDALGVPQITTTEWQQLFHQHAPAWQVEVDSSDDRPGAVVFREGQPVVDTDNAIIYTQSAFTRFNGQVLPQLVYSLWFPRRTATSALDPYAGEFDAVIWRVTLDQQGRPLVYDSIHGCGCYHYVYPAQRLLTRAQEGFWQEPVLYPQPRLPEGRLVLRLQAGTHYLRRVMSSTAVQMGEQHSVALRSYESLLGGQAQRGLFAADGILTGSERLERFWLWPSGVPSPGAMRQWGRHATAFIGRRHFDDAHLLDTLFAVPE